MRRKSISSKSKRRSSKSMSPAPEERTIVRDHLVILQHGLHGGEGDFAYFKDKMDASHPHLLCHIAKANAAFLRTHDGIRVMGLRLVAEIKQLLRTHPEITKFSIVGHSLGGLISRYAVGELFKDGIFNTIEPVVFLSLTSPHVGSRRPSGGLLNWVASSFTSGVLSLTGKELMLEDENPIDGVHMLVHMAQAGTPYIEALKKFHKRVLYANVRKDFMVPYCTSSIVKSNPYLIGERQLKLSTKYPHVVEYTEEISDPLPETGESITETITTAETTIPSISSAAANTASAISTAITAAAIHIAPSSAHLQHHIAPVTPPPPASTSLASSTIVVPSTAVIPSSTATPANNAVASTAIASTMSVAKISPSQELKTKKKIKNSSDEFANDKKADHLRGILNSLGSLSWKRYDVYFDSWLASHTNVLVRNSLFNSAGADVVQHIMDNFLQY